MDARFLFSVGLGLGTRIGRTQLFLQIDEGTEAVRRTAKTR